MSNSKKAEGIIYEYTPGLQLFEFHTESACPHAVVFIGGLSDGLLTTGYLPALHESLPHGWGLYQIIISSSYAGWANGSLDRDCDEIKECVEFIKAELKKDKVVLFGNSTGCQDSMHYVLTREGEGIDGFVMHSPVSDRIATAKFYQDEGKDLDTWNKEAREWGEKYGMRSVLPTKFTDAVWGSSITAYRWLSLNEKGGDDDYFSHDLSDETLKKTFGEVDKPMLILYSGKDECVPKSIDKEGLLKRWRLFVDERYFSKHSFVVPGATHSFAGSDLGALEAGLEATARFLNDLSLND